MRWAINELSKHQLQLNDSLGFTWVQEEVITTIQGSSFGILFIPLLIQLQLELCLAGTTDNSRDHDSLG